MSKKILSYFLIILTTFLVFVQPLSVDAATNTYYSWPLYCQPDLYPGGNLEENIRNNFYYAQSSKGYYDGYRLEEMHVLVFQDVRYPEYIQYVYCHKDNLLVLKTNSDSVSGYDYDDQFGVGPSFNNIYQAVIVCSNGDMAVYSYSYTNIIVTPAQGIIYYTNYDLLNADGSYVCISTESNSGTGDDPFTGDIFEDDFSHESGAFFESLQESMDAADEVIQNTTLETIEDTDNKFLGIFQSFSTMIGNVYSQVETLAHSVTDFVDTFFNEFVPGVIQNGFRGIKTAIEAAVNSIIEMIGNLTGSFFEMLQEWFDWIYTYEFSDGYSLQSIIQFFMDKFNEIIEKIGELVGGGFSILDAVSIILPEPLAGIIDAIYQSGVGVGGTFNLLTCLEYWFVPDTEIMRNRIDEIHNAEPSIMQIKLAGTSLRDELINIEPVAPLFTMPSTTFIVPGTNGEKSYTLPEITIGFEWFKSWKPYTDFFIAAFLYITYFWHLLTSLPSLFSGGSATVAHVPETKDKPLETNWSDGIFRK